MGFVPHLLFPMTHTVSDIEIIQKVLSGDKNSFAGIVRKYKEKVLQLCFSITGREQAEDAAQEIFLKVYESLGDFRGQSSFSTWLYRIAYNHCLNLLAKRKRERSESLEGLVQKHGERLPLSGFNPNSMNRTENRQIVDSALLLLSPDERMILTLREIQGFSYKEISELLQISVDTVKVRLFRARNSFAQIAKKLL